MIRHISIFKFKDMTEKDENIARVRAYLETMPSHCSLIKNQVVAVPAVSAPAIPEDAPMMFGDLVQICDFENAADAGAYPASAAHIQLTEFSSSMVQKVTAIDYEL